jgi:hypothetical protein
MKSIACGELSLCAALANVSIPVAFATVTSLVNIFKHPVTLLELFIYIIGTVLQAGWLRVQFSVRSSNFSIDLILQAVI